MKWKVRLVGFGYRLCYDDENGERIESFDQFKIQRLCNYLNRNRIGPDITKDELKKLLEDI